MSDPRADQRTLPAVVERLQTLLDAGQAVNEAAREVDVKSNTVHKAVRAGRLRVPSKKKRRAS